MFITTIDERDPGILEHDTLDWRRQNNIPDSDEVGLGNTRKRSDLDACTALINSGQYFVWTHNR
jgi:hypothetical protein